ncbi:predicted protein [Chaetoceros tenuissimus]|uniref:SAP domain-containing protein n=1 Tax=Chaetoceros tenuissimus TaxID=426638 RepID=A0AAD3CGW4_9STRA|nr:predicted protein [Chaetoceros tenuissimus]
MDSSQSHEETEGYHGSPFPSSATTSNDRPAKVTPEHIEQEFIHLDNNDGLSFPRNCENNTNVRTTPTYKRYDYLLDIPATPFITENTTSESNEPQEESEETKKKREELLELPIQVLKTLAKTRDLRRSGSKEELVERLLRLQPEILSALEVTKYLSHYRAKGRESKARSRAKKKQRIDGLPEADRITVIAEEKAKDKERYATYYQTVTKPNRMEMSLLALIAYREWRSDDYSSYTLDLLHDQITFDDIQRMDAFYPIEKTGFDEVKHAMPLVHHFSSVGHLDQILCASDLPDEVRYGITHLAKLTEKELHESQYVTPSFFHGRKYFIKHRILPFITETDGHLHEFFDYWIFNPDLFTDTQNEVPFSIMKPVLSADTEIAATLLGKNKSRDYRMFVDRCFKITWNLETDELTLTEMALTIPNSSPKKFEFTFDKSFWNTTICSYINQEEHHETLDLQQVCDIIDAVFEINGVEMQNTSVLILADLPEPNRQECIDIVRRAYEYAYENDDSIGKPTKFTGNFLRFPENEVIFLPHNIEYFQKSNRQVNTIAKWIEALHPDIDTSSLTLVEAFNKHLLDGIVFQVNITGYHYYTVFLDFNKKQIVTYDSLAGNFLEDINKDHIIPKSPIVLDEIKGKTLDQLEFGSITSLCRKLGVKTDRDLTTMLKTLMRPLVSQQVLCVLQEENERTVNDRKINLQEWELILSSKLPQQGSGNNCALYTAAVSDILSTEGSIDAIKDHVDKLEIDGRLKMASICCIEYGIEKNQPEKTVGMEIDERWEYYDDHGNARGI